MSKFNVNLIRGNVDFTKSTATRAINHYDKTGASLTVKGGKYLSPVTYNSVENIDSGLNVLIHTPVMNFIAHIMPNIENMQTVAQKIVEIAATLRDETANKTGEVFAFITGGKSSDHNDPISANGTQMLNKMFDALEEEGIETTVIASPYEDRPSALTTCTRMDRINCTGGMIDSLPEIPTGATNKEIQEILEDHFEFVEISPNAKIKILDTIG